ncbi:hypothetical protein XIS1_1030025 [Xenorhabdus innexi]|uniref:Uncharacterized protein n=1 Tax=Xenorhabdus innexi TaxID=290109 RepID=A0A1N6MQF7_9GAMM|nr:hypothetical protein XIS1_1030025 [Xenorhabdus innexi]
MSWLYIFINYYFQFYEFTYTEKANTKSTGYIQWISGCVANKEAA